MYVLNIQKALEGLKTQKGVENLEFGSVAKSPWFGDPEQFELFYKFYRIMTAERLSDIEDISAEEIVELFPKVSEFAGFFSVEDSFMQSFSVNFHKCRSAMRRRIL